MQGLRIQDLQRELLRHGLDDTIPKNKKGQSQKLQLQSRLQVAIDQKLRRVDVDADVLIDHNVYHQPCMDPRR